MTSHKIINSKSAPAAMGAYNHATVYNGIVYCAGQIGYDPETMKFVSETDVKAQTRQVMKNLGSVLESAGSGFPYVLKVNIFIKNMDDFALVNEVYGEYFQKESAPARACVEVARLPKDALVEIECTAYVPQE